VRRYAFSLLNHERNNELKRRDTAMKKLMLGAATAAVLLTAAAPAMAQVGVRVGPVGVGIGAPYYNYYGGCGYNYPCGGGGPYYDYYGGPSVVIGGGGWHGHPHFHGHWHR
jgi:hypothetical protein